MIGSSIIGTVKYPYSCDMDHVEVHNEEGWDILDDLLKDFKDVKVKITIEAV